MFGAFSRSSFLTRIRKYRPGAAGLMTSILGWRQAFESAEMLRARSAFRAENVRAMSCYRRSLQHVLAGAAIGAIALGNSAVAADLPVKAPALKTIYSWTGFYLGGHIGYGSGSLGPDSNPEP